MSQTNDVFAVENETLTISEAIKFDHGLGRNHLRGSEGDRLNAVLSAAGFNLRKLLAAVFYTLISWLLQRLNPQPAAMEN